MAGPAGLAGFVHVLRENGLEVGIDASVLARDALASLPAADLAAPDVVQAALRATLLPRAEDRAVFDELFARYFRRRPRPASSIPDLAAVAAERGLSDGAKAALAGEGALGGVFGDGAKMAQALEQAMGRTDVSGLKSPLQVGYFAERLLQQSGAEAQLAQWARGLDPDDRGPAEAVVRERLIQLRQLARRLMHERFELLNLDFAGALAQRSLLNAPFAQLNADDDELQRAIERLCRRLHARSSSRLRRSRRGRVDLRRTLRHAWRTEGVVFAPRHKRRKRERPEVLLLCDVSDSVRTASTFMLRFVHAVSDVFVRVRSFMFVADIAESTALFAEAGVDAAIDAVLGGDVVSVYENSDYGRALRQFAAGELSSITGRTSVLILGDGRTNYKDSEAWVVEEMRRRAKKVWWVCPERQENWGFGDSRMGEYARAVDEVLVVRSVRALYNLVDRLAR